MSMNGVVMREKSKDLPARKQGAISRRLEKFEGELIEAYEKALFDGIEPVTAIATIEEWLAIESRRSSGMVDDRCL